MAAIVMALSGAAAHAQPAAKTTSTANAAQQAAALKWTKQRAIAYAKLAWHWEDLMGLHRTRFSASGLRTRSLPYAQWVVRSRQSIAHRLHVRGQHWMAHRIPTLEELIRQQQESMGQHPYARGLEDSPRVEVVFDRLQRLARQVTQEYQNPPQKANFECIHRFEGSWTDQDSGHNGHYGGVQMGKAEWDMFGRPYTGKEYPYQASELDQLWAAARYWEVSGFHPWPATAHDCGLL